MKDLKLLRFIGKKKIIFIIFFFAFVIFVALKVRLVSFYYIGKAGESYRVIKQIKVLPIKKELSCKEILNSLVNIIINKKLNGELIPYMQISDVKIREKICNVYVNICSRKAQMSSFGELRTLLIILKTLKGFDRNLKIFKINGLESSFKHIDTRFPVKVDGNNLIMVY